MMTRHFVVNIGMVTALSVIPWLMSAMRQESEIGIKSIRVKDQV